MRSCIRCIDILGFFTHFLSFFFGFFCWLWARQLGILLLEMKTRKGKKAKARLAQKKKDGNLSHVAKISSMIERLNCRKRRKDNSIIN